MSYNRTTRAGRLVVLVYTLALSQSFSAAEDVEVPGVSFYLTIELGEDLGQNHGTLFEARDSSGRRVAGAGFLGAYNTYSRNARELVHLYVRTGDPPPPFAPEPLPRANDDAGVYLYDHGGQLHARSRGGADPTSKIWDPKSRAWQLGDAAEPNHVSVAGKTLEVSSRGAHYDGREILRVETASTRLGEHYYGGGMLIVREHAVDAALPVNRLVACDWAPGRDRAVPLTESPTIDLRTPREFVYAYGQLGHQVLAATNTGGLYVLEDNLWTCFLEPDTQVSFQVYAMLNYRDRLLLGHYPTGELYEYDGLTLRLLPNWPPAPPTVRKQAREAQTLTIYGGNLYCGVWPWGEVWRYDEDRESSQPWSFLGRLFDHPAPSTETTHPYEKETRALGEVINRWGQRVTSMVPLGDALYLATSAKSPAPWDPRFAFLDERQRLDYGTVYRYREPGSLAARLAWKEGRTHLEFRISASALRIFQDHREVASTQTVHSLSALPTALDITWGDGVFGRFRGRLSAREARPRTVGPETDTRFPPLQVPEGFEATLFACDPLIEYPSSIALGPRPGTVFVAHDYMTGYGTEIIRPDEVRLVEDVDADGYADRTTIFADGFHSIQGLTFDGETLFVVHAPLLTSLTDTDGDGVADMRRDLLAGLGLTPEANPVRLHSASGIQLGHDDWLYIALGDHGCDVERPEGDRLVLEGGGILRVRRDGSDLHVFASGLRNFYDVALDADLNVFVRDNENDGGDYMIRWYESFHGADHGYPYLYYEKPHEALLPLADLGRGSSAGGVCYLEDSFPEDYRGNLIFCEWGRSVVRYPLERSASTFKTQDEIEIAHGAEGDPYGFKPTDILVDHDGSVLVCDWADGQRPHRGRARLYRIRSKPDAVKEGAVESAAPRTLSTPALLEQLDASSYHARYRAHREGRRRGEPLRQALSDAMQAGTLGPRGRGHAVWLLAHGDEPTETLFAIASNDTHWAVRQQVVRALADLHDPILVSDGLDVQEVPEGLAERLADLALAPEAAPPLVRAVIVALGRFGWKRLPSWLLQHGDALGLASGDTALEHAAQQALRRTGQSGRGPSSQAQSSQPWWSGVLALLDDATGTLRQIAVRALARRFDVDVADDLISRLAGALEPAHRAEAADLLAKIHRKPSAWVYWGYRPPPRPRNTADWERTSAIEVALGKAFADPEPAVRIATLDAMVRNGVLPPADALGEWLQNEMDAQRTNKILTALKSLDTTQADDALARFASDRTRDTVERRSALTTLLEKLPPGDDSRLVTWAKKLQGDPLEQLVLAELALHSASGADEVILVATQADDVKTRLAGIEALAAHNLVAAGPRVRELLDDPSVDVQHAAVRAAGKLGLDDTESTLLALSATDNPTLQGAVLTALHALGKDTGRALAQASLEDRASLLPALAYLARWGGPQDAVSVVARVAQERSSDVLQAATRTLLAWRVSPPGAPAASRRESRRRNNDVEDAVAQMQGNCGTVLAWSVAGALTPRSAAALRESAWKRRAEFAAPIWQTFVGEGPDATVELAAAEQTTPHRWLATSRISVPETSDVEFLAGSDGKLSVWVDGDVVYRRRQRAAYRADADRFPARLGAGPHRVLVEIEAENPPRFHLRFRERRSSADRESLLTSALSGRGNADRGRTVFLDANKSQCIKCHRLGAEGGRIGPALTGVGRRFSRIHLVESILEPSRTIAPSYGTVTVVVRDGQVLSGVRVAETSDTLTLGNAEGKTQTIRLAQVAQVTPQEVSTMPEDLHKGLTEQEFLDLVAFLLAQKS